MTHSISTIWLVFFLTLFTTACSDAPTLTLKPRAYPKVAYPEKSYQDFKEPYCPFSFQYPTYARIVKDTAFFGEKPLHECWFDLYFTDFDSRLYCSYLPIASGEEFEKLQQDAFKLADKHNKKANYIDEIRIDTEQGVSGFAFVIEGPAASPFQFFLTDSTDHFLRASLYFNAQVNPDSIAPVYHFIREDILKLIETFQWN
ncbi:MAG TPA: hypothetical protein PKA00_01490 [Saprospiraceae bacterium]|nr:hypothetical protein [Saprospiraceae bacterium]HMQ81542.1 hypothetical protein [Saprospiraceae bacterium]